MLLKPGDNRILLQKNIALWSIYGSSEHHYKSDFSGVYFSDFQKCHRKMNNINVLIVKKYLGLQSHLQHYFYVLEDEQTSSISQ